MMNLNKTTISLTLIGLFVLAGSANADTVEESGLENEITQCLSAVRQQLNYDDAIGVRHIVNAIDRRTVGYTMTIETEVIGGQENETIRAYASTCVVNGNNKPLRFEINETR